MKRVGEMTQAELAAFVQDHLARKGIDVVLSGGAAVALYTSHQYVSKDLDLVNRYFARRSAIKQAMEELGFREVGRHFAHTDTSYFVEFPPGPLSIGEDANIRIDEIALKTGRLRVISPTDSVKDRLSWYVHSRDAQCLEQAILISSHQTIDLGEIERWAKAEGKLADFRAIEVRLRGRRPSR